ncbi:hypothetical protein NHX12_008410 [Muraenolepis orangiensis]|uniref:Clarin 1 n=1 Tax=Muraenolepis orangiensis TaxID=630683 RepID=A0A9Q0DL88_9TELE|nr:hypothetical protein NHX12_008410 [Muraenolepis orangiensis]
MSNRQKRPVLCVAGALGFVSVLTVAVSLGTPRWLRGTVLCHTGAQLVNASGAELDKFLGRLSYGLFQGERVKQCGLGGRPLRFYFFPGLHHVIPVGLHITVVFFCGVLVVFSSLATGFFFFNALGSPYETLQGPLGLYLWSASCCVCNYILCSQVCVTASRVFPGVCSCMVMILFAAEVKLQHLSSRIANFNEVFVYRTHSESYDVSFWLILLVFFLHALNFLLIRLAGIDFPFREKESDQVTTGAADLMY